MRIQCIHIIPDEDDTAASGGEQRSDSGSGNNRLFKNDIVRNLLFISTRRTHRVHVYNIQYVVVSSHSPTTQTDGATNKISNSSRLSSSSYDMRYIILKLYVINTMEIGHSLSYIGTSIGDNIIDNDNSP